MCIYACVYVYIYIYAYACVYIYIYIYIIFYCLPLFLRGGRQRRGRLGVTGRTVS